jgi:hypothetical protein
VVAELLCYPFGAALAAVFTDGRGDDMPHLSRAGIIRALQRRHEGASARRALMLGCCIASHM